jgi:hypothetical protein
MIRTLSLSLYFLLSCNGLHKEQSKPPKLNPLQSLISSFDSSHTNNQNNLLRQKNNNSFYQALSQRAADRLFDSIPVEFKFLKKIEKDKYAAHFVYSKNFTHFDLIALVSPTLIDSLEDKRQYFVNGKFVRFLDDDYSLYTDRMAYSNEFSITDKYNITCGIALIDSATIKKVD